MTESPDKPANPWCLEWSIDSPPPERNALAAYYNWLCEQEEKTSNMGKRIEAELERHNPSR